MVVQFLLVGRLARVVAIIRIVAALMVAIPMPLRCGVITHTIGCLAGQRIILLTSFIMATRRVQPNPVSRDVRCAASQLPVPPRPTVF